MPQTDPEFKRLRAAKMLELKVGKNMTYAQLAAEFNVSTKTVERTLDWAKRAGLVANYEDAILEKLVPAALEAFATALAEGDTQVALEVLKGTGLLKKQTDKPAASPLANDGDDLEIYIRKIRGSGPDDEQRRALPFTVTPLGLPAAPATATASPVLEGALVEAAIGDDAESLA